MFQVAVFWISPATAKMFKRTYLESTQPLISNYLGVAFLKSAHGKTYFALQPWICGSFHLLPLIFACVTTQQAETVVLITLPTVYLILTDTDTLDKLSLHAQLLPICRPLNQHPSFLIRFYSFAMQSVWLCFLYVQRWVFDTILAHSCFSSMAHRPLQPALLCLCCISTISSVILCFIA